jgi:DNA-binding LacI/PurR family transcriptional regulator
MNKRNKNVTIVDIARELGVSTAMVSMVLSGKGLNTG